MRIPNHIYTTISCLFLFVTTSFSQTISENVTLGKEVRAIFDEVEKGFVSSDGEIKLETEISGFWNSLENVEKGKKPYFISLIREKSSLKKANEKSEKMTKDIAAALPTNYTVKKLHVLKYPDYVMNHFGNSLPKEASPLYVFHHKNDTDLNNNLYPYVFLTQVNQYKKAYRFDINIIPSIHKPEQVAYISRIPKKKTFKGEAENWGNYDIVYNAKTKNWECTFANVVNVFTITETDGVIRAETANNACVLQFDIYSNILSPKNEGSVKYYFNEYMLKPFRIKKQTKKVDLNTVLPAIVDRLYFLMAEKFKPSRKYSLNFDNNKINGYAVAFYNNLGVYIGNFENGKRSGNGNLLISKRSYYGPWANGTKHGKFINRNTEGTQKGNYVVGIKEGNWVNTYKDGKILEFNFVNGIQQSGKVIQQAKSTPIDYSKNEVAYVDEVAKMLIEGSKTEGYKLYKQDKISTKEKHISYGGGLSNIGDENSVATLKVVVLVAKEQVSSSLFKNRSLPVVNFKAGLNSEHDYSSISQFDKDETYPVIIKSYTLYVKGEVSIGFYSRNNEKARILVFH